MFKAALAMVLIGCAIALALALSALHAGNSRPQSNEPKDKVSKNDDGKKPVEPAKDVNKDSGVARKKSGFGTKAKMPVGKQLLETKRTFVKAWKVDDLLKKVQGGLSNRDFDRGKKLYTEVKCVLCHTYGQDEGGFIGPALTDVGARFSAADILYSIIEPSKVIADAYAQRTCGTGGWARFHWDGRAARR